MQNHQPKRLLRNEKLNMNRECCQSCCYQTKVCLQKFLKFLFSHVGLCALVTGYAVLGALVFQAIELPYEQERHGHIDNDTEYVVQQLLKYTKSQAVLRPAEWRREAERLLKDYEGKLVYAANQEGYDGKTHRTQWTFFGSLLYSITVFSTIGYGNIAPKTKLGRVVTMVYATIGIPLMLLCLATIAETLAHVFAFVYFKICCFYCRWKRSQKRVKSAALSTRTQAIRRAQSLRVIGTQRSTEHKIKRNPSALSGPSKIANDARSIRSMASVRKQTNDVRSIKSVRSQDQRRAERRDSRQKQEPVWDTRSLPGRMLHQQLQVCAVTDASPERKPASRLIDYSPSLRKDYVRQKLYEDISEEPELPKKSASFKEIAENYRSGSGLKMSSLERPPSEVTVRVEEYGTEVQLDQAKLTRVASKRHTFCDCLRSQKTGTPSASIELVDSKEKMKERKFNLPILNVSSAPKILETHEVETSPPVKAAPQSDMFMKVTTDERDATSGHITTSEEDDVLALSDEDKELPNQRSLPMKAREDKTTEKVVSKASSGDTMSVRSLRRTANVYTSRSEKMPVSVGVVVVILFILNGAILFSFWEKWSLFDGAYFCFITLTTIGFGDLVPGNSLGPHSEEKLVICCLYLLFGMALIAMCFKLMQDDVVRKTQWLGQKIGLLVKEDDDTESDTDMEPTVPDTAFGLPRDTDEDIVHSSEKTHSTSTASAK